jgi:hypothetical protein
MSIQSNLIEMNKSLKKLEKSGIYDVEKYSYALLHQTSQLEYFYCHLVKDGDCDQTFYHIHKRPHVHDLAYFNIGRGFPKELMDGHWCYVLKDMGYKMLVIPCTSIKSTSSPANPQFEKDIKIKTETHIAFSRIQLSDIRSIDIQRLDLRKPFYEVLTERKEIMDFVEKNLFE